jgi:hypothetical protein
MVRRLRAVEKSALTLKSRKGLPRNDFIIAAKIDRLALRTTVTRRGRPCTTQSLVRTAQAPRLSPQTVLGQVLGHQEAAQVTLASVAWPLRLGWKKSRVLTWLAVNW